MVPRRSAKTTNIGNRHSPEREEHKKKPYHTNSCSVSPPTKGIIPPQQGEEGEQRNETVRVWKRTQHDPPAAPNQIIQRTTVDTTRRHGTYELRAKRRPGRERTTVHSGRANEEEPAVPDEYRPWWDRRRSVPWSSFLTIPFLSISFLMEAHRVVCKKKCTRYNIRYINWTRTDLRT